MRKRRSKRRRGGGRDEGRGEDDEKELEGGIRLVRERVRQREGVGD